MDANEDTALSDAELIAFALEVAKRHKGRAIRDAIPGVTEHDISRWNANQNEGRQATLTTNKRRAIQAARRAQVSSAPDSGSESRALERALIRLLAGAESAEPWFQLEILREVGAVKRAIAAEHDSRAAERRAEAQLEDARASGQRLAALAGEAADGRWRRMAMEAIRTGKVPPEAFRGIEIPIDEPAVTKE